MNQPLISIIIATYNSGKTLRRSLESVRAQKFQDWECIVVDGLSKDNTISIVSEFVNVDRRFRYITESDNGIYDAFNKGWRMSKGKWISYLGSDDWFTEESFSNMELIDLDENIAVVSGGAYIVKGQNDIDIQKSVGWNGCHQAKLTRRSVLEHENGFNETYRILADKDLYIRLRNKGYKVLNVPDMVAYFCVDGVSQKFKTLIERYKENIKIYSDDPQIRFPRLLSLYIFAKSLIFNMKSVIRVFLNKRIVSQKN